MNKKLLIFALTLILGIVGFGGASLAAEDTVDYNYIKAYEILENLGIITDDWENQPITRGLFTEMFVKALNIDTDSAYINPFSDVSGTHKHKDAISAAYEWGYANGYGDNTFRPDREITFEECKYLAYKALGVTAEIAQINRFAREIDKSLSEGISNLGKNFITKEESVIFIYNMLNSKTVEIGLMGDSSVDFGTNLLYQNFRIYEISGVVTANSYASLNGNGGLGDGKIRIEDTIYTAAEEKLAGYYELLGFSVDAFVREGEHNDILISMSKTADNRSLNIKSYNLAPGCFDGKELSYAQEDTPKKARISDTAVFMINGVYTGSQTELSAFDIALGDITLIDSNGDREFDFVSIMDYSLLVAGNFVTQGSQRIFDQYNVSDYIDFGDDGSGIKINVFIDGVPSSHYSILTNDVLSYAVSVRESGEKIINVRINRNTVTGRIEALSEDTVVIDGKEFRIAAALKQSPLRHGDELVVGKDVTAKFNYLDEITLIQNLEQDGLNYGFVLQAAENSSLSKKLMFKVYTTSSDFVTLSANEWVRIDKVKYNDINSIKLKLAETRLSLYQDYTDVIYQVVKYKVSDGVLTDIYTTAYEHENAPSLDFDFKSRYCKSTNTFGSEWRDFVAAGKSTFMFIPTASEDGTLDEEGFYICHTDNMKNGGTYNIAAYDCDEMRKSSFMVVNYDYDEQYGNSPINYLVTKKVMVLDDKGEERQQLTVMYKRITYKYYVKDKSAATDISPGDMVNLIVDIDNNIVYIRKVLDISAEIIQQGFNSDDAKNAYNNRYRNMVGYLEAYKEGWGWVSYNAAYSADSSEIPSTGIINMSQFTVWYVDRKVAEIHPVEDCVNYLSNTGLDYLLFVSETYGSVMDIIIYVL